MAVDNQLQLTDGTNTYTFDIGDAPDITQSERIHKTAADPPELEGFVERWHFPLLRILGSSAENAWDNLNTFLAHVEDRTTDPLTKAIINRITGTGAPVAERTLGPSTYQEFRLEEVGFPDDPAVGGARWRLVIPISLTFSARRVFADADGMVSWQQSVSSTYVNGLHELEWKTTIEVAEGAANSALTLAKLYAVIPIADWGNTYVFDGDSNNENGFSHEYPDSDENNSRTPTTIVCSSKIRQLGIAIGTPSAGNSVNGATYSVEVVKDGPLVTTITRASADGPTAYTWVKSKRPNGQLAYSRQFDGRATRHAEGEWTKITQNLVRWEMRLTITGGHQDVEFLETSGNYPPREVRGVYRPLRLEVEIVSRYIGVDPKTSTMPFPPPLTTPWVMKRNEVREDAVPRRVRIGTERSYDEWERRALVVYVAAEQTAGITVSTLERYAFDPAENQKVVPTYLLTAEVEEEPVT